MCAVPSDALLQRGIGRHWLRLMPRAIDCAFGANQFMGWHRRPGCRSVEELELGILQQRWLEVPHVDADSAVFLPLERLPVRSATAGLAANRAERAITLDVLLCFLRMPMHNDGACWVVGPQTSEPATE